MVVFFPWEPTEIESTDVVFTGGLVTSGPFCIVLVDLISAMVFCRTVPLLFNRSVADAAVVLPNALLERGLGSGDEIRI